MLDVDLTEYNKLNQAFIGYFSQMGFDFNVSMKCATDAIYRNKTAKKLGMTFRSLRYRLKKFGLDTDEET